MILRVVDYLCGSKQNKIVKKINFTKSTFLIKSVTKTMPLGLLQMEKQETVATIQYWQKIMMRSAEICSQNICETHFQIHHSKQYSCRAI